MNNNNKISERKINSNDSLINALKQMDKIDKKILLVFNDNSFLNVLSIGDIQRAIIKNIPLNSEINAVLRKKTTLANTTDSFDSIKQKMIDGKIELMPVVGDNNILQDVYFWEDIFNENKTIDYLKFNLPVVIMAGGFGTRLKPLTNVLPKPLIPIGDKTMLEEIFDRFAKHGCNNFFISVNYKSELIEFYIKNQNLPYKIEYFREEKPMGTAGSLSLLKGKLTETFFVNNCDILIEQDYSEILNYHRENKNEITLVAALKTYPIPYGTLETGESGKLLEIKEKPEFTFKINSGMYILEPHLLNEITDDMFFHITHLVEKVKNRNGRVGVFPISEKSWKDVGNWEEYLSNFKQ